MRDEIEKKKTNLQKIKKTKQMGNQKNGDQI